MLTIKTYKDLDRLRELCSRPEENGQQKVRAYKFVTEEGVSPISDHVIQYVVGQEHEVSVFDTNIHNDCGAGINLATLQWCEHTKRDWHKIFVMDFRIKDVVAIPIVGEGKFRVKRCIVVRERGWVWRWLWHLLTTDIDRLITEWGSK